MSGFEPFIAYEASAGSGKTFALTLRYISLLFLGNHPSKILTLTFTNKASNEMKTRIEKTLKNLDKDGYEVELDELSKLLDVDKQKILSQKDEIYQRFLKSENYILTIDKFCALILRKFAFYVGLMPDFTIEQKESLPLVMIKFISYLHNGSLYGDFIKFSVYEQKKLNAVFNIFYYFYEKFYKMPPFKEQKSFKELKILELFNSLKKEILICEKLSPSGKKALDIDSVEDIYKKTWFAKNSLGEYSYFKKCYDKSWDEKFMRLKDLAKEYILYKEASYINNLLNFFHLFKEANFKVKKEINDLRFLDIANFAYKILHEAIDRDFFYFRLDAKFDHLLLDEFQDTSILQFEILKPLFDEISSGEGVSTKRSIFYVGDVKQSIYRFRGGSKELFYEVASKYNLEIKRLNKNYRSKKEIVEFVNDIFLGVMDGYFRQEAYDSSSSGYVEVVKDDDILHSVKEALRKLLNVGVKDDDIAILTYTNDDAFVIEEELKKEFKDISIATQTSMLLISSNEVKIILECMKYLYFKEEFFKSNLLALLGKDIDDELDFSTLDISLSPLDFAYRCIEKFELNSESVLEFLNEARRYDDIESLLFHLDEFQAQLPQPEIKGVKILTIHKSKGLEFKHLLVCDRLKRKNSDRSSFIIYQEGLEVKDIFLKVKNREFIDEDYHKALEYEKKLSKEDELNAIYVAFTRAKESLFILSKEKNSAFEFLQLEPETRGELLINKNDETLLRQNIFEYQEPRVKKQEIIAKDSDRKKESDFEAINFGIATHYMLEMLDGFEKSSFKSAYEAMKNRYLDILGEIKINDIANRVNNLLTNKEFLKMLDSKNIYKELPLVFDNELKQIDLLLEDKDSIVIIDYKTSNEVQNEHIKQVSNYVNIIKKIKAKETKGYLCYLKRDEIKFVKVEYV